jgi:hypothetical protein
VEHWTKSHRHISTLRILLDRLFRFNSLEDSTAQWQPRGRLAPAVYPHSRSVCASLWTLLDIRFNRALQVGEPTLIANLQHSVPNLWLRATWVGVDPTCLQHISRAHVQRLVMPSAEPQEIGGDQEQQYAAIQYLLRPTKARLTDAVPI